MDVHLRFGPYPVTELRTTATADACIHGGVPWAKSASSRKYVPNKQEVMRGRIDAVGCDH
jgi:hypothetical protein